jgi:hypothetical protein
MKQIENFENYFVDKAGNVFSNRQGKLKKLSLILTKYGYYEVTLCGEKQVRKKIHRLIGEVFIPNPDNKLQINHINGIKTDNRVENLEWVTSQENHLHARKEGLILKPPIENKRFLRKNGSGEQNSRSKLTEQDVRNIRKNTDNKTHQELAKEYLVAPSTISGIIARIRWTHI